MRRGRLLLLVVLAAPVSASAATSNVVQPVGRSLAVGPGVLRTAYGPNDTVLIRTATPVNMAFDCSVFDPSHTFVGHPTGGTSTDGQFTLGTSVAAGVWTVECGGATNGTFQGVSSGPVHGKLWSMDGTSAECSSFTYQGPLCEPLAEYRTGHVSDGSYASAGAIPDVDDPMLDGTWLREDAWYWILDVHLPLLASDDPGSSGCSATESPRVPDYSVSPATITCVTTSSLTSPSGVVATTEATDREDYAKILTRLTLAYRMARIYNLNVGGSDSIGDNEAFYRGALAYWMNELVAPSGAAKDIWTDSDDNEDLGRSHLLQAVAMAYDWTAGDPAIDVVNRATWQALLGDQAQALFLKYIENDTAGVYGQYDRSGGTLIWEQPSWVNHHRRVMLNGHTWATYSAIGVAVAVLRPEMAGASGLRNDLDLWSSFGFGEALGYRGDGATTSGVDYWESDTSDLLRYLEAARTVDGVDYDTEAWPENGALFLAHMTDPNGQRVMLADSGPDDFANPAWVMDLGARIYGSSSVEPLAQRLAWLGHNDDTGIDPTHRDVWDVLWWSTDRARWSSSDVDSDLYPHACFPDTGLVSLRDTWGSDGTHLEYRGGELVGGHDGGQVGDFVLYRHGHLVSSDGVNNHTKRTANASTLIIGGNGQHGDALRAGEAAPESTTQNNNSWLVTYLDGKGAAAYSYEHTETINGIEYTYTDYVDHDVDVVGFGTDLTQLYRYDTGAGGDILRGAAGMTDVDLDNTLDRVRRYMMWLGQDIGPVIFDFDIIESTDFTALRSDWNLQAYRFDQDSLPAPVAASTGSSGRYVWESTTSSATRDLAFYPFDTLTSSSACPLTVSTIADRWPCIDDSSASTVSARRSLYRDLNKNLWQPQPASTYTSAISTSGTSFIVDASTGQGHLQVTAFESGASMDSYYTPGLSGDTYGGTIAGEHLGRSHTNPDQVFLTELQPYVGATYSPASVSSVTNGYAATVYLDSALDAYLLFADGGDPTDSTSELQGDVGLILVGTDTHASETSYPWYAAQMMEATSFQFDGHPVMASAPHSGSGNASVSMAITWDRYSDYGTITGITQPTDISVSVRNHTPIVGLVTYGDGTLDMVSLSRDSTTHMVTFTVDADCMFQIFDDDTLASEASAEDLAAATTAEPRPGSDCF